METKANYVRVGVFTITVLALAFGFIYWSVLATQGTTRVPLLVRIAGSVTGLQQGSQVQFNGLPVGSVQSLRLDPNNPKVVIATTTVEPGIPISESTDANLVANPLTGYSYIELRGGQIDQESLLDQAAEQGTTAVITASPSEVTDILQTARDIAERANNIMTQFEQVVGTVGPSVEESARNITQITGNVSAFTTSLADNTDDIDLFIARLSDLAESANTVAQQLPDTIQNVQTILSAVDPAQIRSIVDNVSATTVSIRDGAENLNAVTEAVQSAAAGVSQIGETIQRNADGIDSFIGNLGPLSETATSVAQKLDTTVTSANEILTAVEPQEVSDAISGISATASNLSAITDTISNARDAIGEFFSRASNAAADVNRVTTTIAARSEALGTALDRIDPITASAVTAADNLSQTGARANELLAGIDAQQISDTVDGLSSTAQNLSAVSETVAAQREAIQSAITGASNTLQNVSAVSDTIAARRDQIDTLLSRLDPISQSVQNASGAIETTANQARQVIAAVDPEEISNTLDGLSSTAQNLSAVSRTVAEQREQISTAISGASNLIQNVNRISTTIANRTEDIDAALANIQPFTDSLRDASGRLSATVEKAGNFVDRIDTDQLNNSIDQIGNLAETIGSKSGTINSIIDGVDTAVGSLNTALVGFEQTRQGLDNILNEVEPQLVNNAVSNVSSASGNIARAADSIGRVGDIINERQGEIDEILTNANITSRQVASASGQLDSVITSVNGLLNGQDAGRPLGVEVTEALRSIRAAAQSIQGQVGPLSTNIQNLSDSTRRDVQALTRQLNQTVERIGRAVDDIASDPSQVIFGGDSNVKTYDGRTRR